MLQIQLASLEIAVATAKQIHRLEAVKDALPAMTVDLGRPCKSNPLGLDVEITVDIPQEYARAQISRMLADNHKILADLGIELQP